MLESLGVVIACTGWVSNVELDFAYIPHIRNEENNSFGVIPDLQLFRHKLIYLNVSVYDRKYTKLMTVTLGVMQKKCLP